MLSYVNESLESSMKYKRKTQGGFAIVGYVNANYVRNMDTRKSLVRYVFTLFGTSTYWKANLQLVVALSSTKIESEYIARAKGVKEGLWLKGMISEL